VCGRFTLYHDGVELRTRFFLAPLHEYALRYNIPPGTAIVAITGAVPRAVSLMRWGLIPSWAKDPKIGFKMINARAETVHEKPAYRGAFKKRRCLIPASGWYEWRKNADGTKTPTYFQRKDRSLLALAGIWETWMSPEGKAVESCSIITTAAAPRFTEIHDRMPVVLASIDAWLKEDLDLDGARRLLETSDVDGIETYAVSPMVNSPRVDSPECIRPV
jgi:putative SOS response-associated peptidase YedK